MDKHVDANPTDFKACLEAAYEDLKLAMNTASSIELIPPNLITMPGRTLELIFWSGVSLIGSWFLGHLSWRYCISTCIVGLLGYLMYSHHYLR